MSNVKTAISIKDSLFEEVDSLAKSLHVSRSKLFVMAVEEFIHRHRNQQLLEQINQAYDDGVDTSQWLD